MKLSSYYELDDLTASQTAVRHDFKEQFNPPQYIIDKLKTLATNCLDKIHYEVWVRRDTELTISSGYRCLRLNGYIGGSKNSQHTKGEAADISVRGLTTVELMRIIYQEGIPFDQMIEEFGKWVHISCKASGNRGEILKAYKKDGKTVYEAMKIKL